MEIFRKKGFKMFFAIFAALFMGIFGFGVVNFLGGGGTGLVTVGKKEIKPQDYLRVYENISARNRQNGQNLTPQQENSQKVQALHSLINSNMIAIVAEDMGLAVVEEELIQAIKNSGQFNNDNGEFDTNKYQDILKAQGISIREFEENIKKNILQQKWAKLVLPVANVSAKTGNYFQSRFSRIANFRYFEVPSNIIKPKIEVSEAQLRTFYGERNDSFRTPESYKIELLEISEEIFKDKISTQEIQSYYNNNREKFSQKGSFLASHILFSIDSDLGLEALKKKSEEIYQQVQKNKSSFAALAKKHSDDPGSKTKGGDLGWTSYGNFVKEFEEQVKKMKKGEIAKPFLSQFGYHIVYLRDKKGAKNSSFQDVQVTIKNILVKNKLNNFLKLIFQRSQKEQGFQKISQDYTVPFKADFLVQENSQYKGIPIKSIYNSLKGKPVNTLDTYVVDGKYLFYKLNSFTAGQKIPFEKSKKNVLLAYTQEEHSKVLNTKQKEFLQKYKNKKGFDVLRKQWRISRVINKSLSYNELLKDNPLLLNFRNVIFQLNTGQMIVQKYSDKLFVILLDNYDKKSDEDENIPFTKEQLERIKTSLLIDKLVNFKAQQIGISYNEKLLKQHNIPFK